MTGRIWWSLFAISLLAVLVGGVSAVPARAQSPTAAVQEAAQPGSRTESTEEPAEELVVQPDSPRASLEAYLKAANAGEWDKAARYLALPEQDAARGPVLAERLKAVLDKYLWFDLEKISPESGGVRDDGLSAGVEKVGEIPVGDGRTQPVYLVRRSDDEGHYWAFSPNTVRRIDAWYDRLDDRWIREHLIELGLDRLLLVGPFGLLWWQWLAVPLLVVGAWVLGRVLGEVTRRILGRIFARTRAEWDDRLLRSIGPPLTLAWGLLVFSVALPSLGLTAKADDLFRELVSAGVIVVIFWALWRSVGIITDLLILSPWATGSPSAQNLLKIGANISRGVIVGVGALAVLAAFNYPVTTLLAGLGIGGLAFAFGAQKTVENLFGSISLAVDQPFRVGDFVKVEDFVGTVEEIGLRSTRFRTLDRTVISIPNGNLSGQRLETFAARDRMRLATTIGVEYSTTHEQMQQVLEGFERVLRDHPKIWPDAVVVKFKEFGASSLDIEIMAWFVVPTWGDFQQCRQEALLGFMQVVEDAGTGFAFPTRTVHLFNETTPQPREEPTPSPAPAPSVPPKRDTADQKNLPVSDGE
jgi:MscS family membrane protein